MKRLQDAFAQGDISYDEMDRRLQTALTARTSGDLLPAVASLPEPSLGRTVTIAAKSGRIRRRGEWRVPSRLVVESEFGRLDLDLSRAVFEGREVDIELQLRFGRARITVPAGAVVDLDGLRTEWKQPVYQAPRRTGTDGPLIRISGTMEYGRLRIRHR